MPDPTLKKAYDEWKKEHDEWKKEYNEYDKLRRQYEAKRDVIAQELADKENNKNKAYWSSYFSKSSIEFWSQAEAIMLKQGIEKPVIRKEPIMPCEGYQWVQYTFIQPQPYQEIDYRDLRNENYILCSVKKKRIVWFSE